MIKQHFLKQVVFAFVFIPIVVISMCVIVDTSTADSAVANNATTYSETSSGETPDTEFAYNTQGAAARVDMMGANINGYSRGNELISSPFDENRTAIMYSLLSIICLGFATGVLHCLKRY